MNGFISHFVWKILIEHLLYDSFLNIEKLSLNIRLNFQNLQNIFIDLFDLIDYNNKIDQISTIQKNLFLRYKHMLNQTIPRICHPICSNHNFEFSSKHEQ